MKAGRVNENFNINFLEKSTFSKHQLHSYFIAEAVTTANNPN